MSTRKTMSEQLKKITKENIQGTEAQPLVMAALAEEIKKLESLSSGPEWALVRQLNHSLVVCLVALDYAFERIAYLERLVKNNDA